MHIQPSTKTKTRMGEAASFLLQSPTRPHLRTTRGGSQSLDPSSRTLREGWRCSVVLSPCMSGLQFVASQPHVATKDVLGATPFSRPFFAATDALDSGTSTL